MTNIGQLSHLKHISAARTKKHITIQIDENNDKSQKVKVDKSSPAPNPSIKYL